MSAFVVNRRHIDVLVTGLITRENHRSINARYAEKRRAPKYTFTAEKVEPAVLLKQIHCYQYQTCEHASWKRSRTYRLMKSLEAALVVEGHTPEGEAYNAAPWGV